MTLLITIFAAIISTVVWYCKAPDDKMMTKVLCYLYWGASLMWFVDACFEYAELKAEFFTPAPSDMLNDAYLGLSVVALGLIRALLKTHCSDAKNKQMHSLLV